MTILRVEGISKSYSGALVLDDLSFDLEAGEIIAMIGPNGAGKTTCFNIQDGQLRADRGRVFFGDAAIGAMDTHRILRLGVGRTFQIAATFHSFTVAENVQIALLASRGLLWNLHAAARGLCRDEAERLLEQVGMRAQADRACAVLSYGDLKRVELAIALAGDPRLLLMDEPTAGMAPRERLELMALVARLARERELSILFTEHDMDIVFAHADRILLLEQGRLICQGAPAEVRADPRAQRAYLGRDSDLP
jgi:branched-chain amino acid transport system ATP-binding protein